MEYINLETESSLHYTFILHFSLLKTCTDWFKYGKVRGKGWKEDNILEISGHKVVKLAYNCPDERWEFKCCSQISSVKYWHVSSVSMLHQHKITQSYIKYFSGNYRLQLQEFHVCILILSQSKSKSKVQFKSPSQESKSKVLSLKSYLAQILTVNQDKLI